MSCRTHRHGSSPLELTRPRPVAPAARRTVSGLPLPGSSSKARLVTACRSLRLAPPSRLVPTRSACSYIGRVPPRIFDSAWGLGLELGSRGGGGLGRRRSPSAGSCRCAPGSPWEPPDMDEPAGASRQTTATAGWWKPHPHCSRTVGGSHPASLAISRPDCAARSRGLDVSDASRTTGNVLRAAQPEIRRGDTGAAARVLHAAGHSACASRDASPSSPGPSSRGPSSTGPASRPFPRAAITGLRPRPERRRTARCVAPPSCPVKGQLPGKSRIAALAVVMQPSTVAAARFPGIRKRSGTGCSLTPPAPTSAGAACVATAWCGRRPASWRRGCGCPWRA